MGLLRKLVLGIFWGAATIAHAADLVVVADLAFAKLRQQGQIWEQQTGHRVTWVPANFEDSLAEQIADVYLVAAQKATQLHAELAPIKLTAQQEQLLAPLLAQAWQIDANRYALPLPVPNLPVLYAKQARLAQYKIELDLTLSWDELAKLANTLTDPLGDVHGICIDPRFPHGQVIRAMLLASQVAIPTAIENYYADSNWQVHASTYARMLAASGPPNAAHLSQFDFDQLVATERCALWLSQLQLQPEADLVQRTVAGSGAFLTTTRPVLAISQASTNKEIATEFIWWLLENSEQAYPEYLSGYLPANANFSAQQQIVIEALLSQTQFVPAVLDWQQIDSTATPALSKLIDGLIPVTVVANEAQTAAKVLKQN